MKEEYAWAYAKSWTGWRKIGWARWRLIAWSWNPTQDLERPPVRTPTKEFSKEVETSSLNDHTPSIIRRRFRLSSQRPPKNIIGDPNKDTQTKSSLKTLCAFSAFFSLVEPKDVKEAIKEPEVNSMSLKEIKFGI